MKSYNKQIVSKISDLIPPHIKLTEYLMGVLKIGRESAYRRIRDQVPFTFDEIATLSRLLNFSLDEIIGINNPDGKVTMKSFINPERTGSETFFRIMDEYCNHLIKGEKADDFEVIVANNRILIFYFMNHPHLLRFFYYKCCRQNDDIPANTEFSDIELPAKIIEMSKSIWHNAKHIKKEIFIFDDNIFLSLLKEIQFYYRRKLVTKEELNLLKEDFYRYLSYVDSLCLLGRRGESTDISFYVSSVNTETNQMFIKYDDNVSFTFYYSSFTPLYVTEQNMCLIFKKYLDNHKKYSVLITESNEIEQAQFFKKQYDALERLGKEAI